MTVENITKAPAALATPAATLRGKAATPGAQGLSGFFALLSAADGALAAPMSLDPDASADGALGNGQSGARNLLGETELPDGKDGLAVVALVGLPVDVTPELPELPEVQTPVASAGSQGGKPAPQLPVRVTTTMQETESGSSTAGAAATKKAAKPLTAQLADEPAKSRWVAPSGKELMPEKADPVSSRTLLDTMQAAPVERASTAMQMIANERKAPDQQGQKYAPAGPVYFQPQASSAPMGMDGVVGAGAAAPMDTYVAEQVSYWITQDVQNAELTLDGIGHGPVEVSISMQGNEAQVAFHTDESAARQALENASDQLKDMLQRQGLVLAGVTVGNSQTGDSGQQQRRSRQEGRQALVTSDVLVDAAQGRRLSPTTGGAVDLFV
jgi:flagellar hook-length control protein FliK